MAKKFYQINKKNWINEILESVKHEVIKSKDFIALEKLENIEIKLLYKNNKKIDNKKIKEIQNKLEKLKKPINEVVLLQIVKRLDKLRNEKESAKEVLIETIEELMKVIKK